MNSLLEPYDYRLIWASSIARWSRRWESFDTTAGFVAKPNVLPIGIVPDGRTHAFLYLLVSPVQLDFRVFLRRHAELLRALPAWSIQLLVPVEQTDTEGRAQDLADLYETAFRLELGAPLDPVTANELRWFWEASTLASGKGEEKRMRRARRIVGTPRFRALRRALELVESFVFRASPGCRDLRWCDATTNLVRPDGEWRAQHRSGSAQRALLGGR